MNDAPVPPLVPGGETTLLRRIRHEEVVDDGQGGLRISSQAFDPRPGDEGVLSVYVEEVLESMGLGATDVLVGHNKFGLIAVATSFVRGRGLTVILRPDGSDGLRGEAHAEVSGNLNHTTRTHLARASDVREWPADP